MSGTAITRSQRVSKIGVMDTLHAADEKDLSWEDVEGGCPTTICPPLSAIPRTSQANSIDIADGRDISWSDMEGMSDDESHLLFHSDHHVRENAYAEPHMHRVRAEMARGEHYGSAFRTDTETAKRLVPTTRNNHHFGDFMFE